MNIPRDEQHVLVADLGAGGPKVGLVSVTGRVAWQQHFPVETQWLDGGGAVQDPEVWWRLIRDGARQAIADGHVDAANIVAVSMTAQWASTVPVAADGTPTGECVLYYDTRGTQHVADQIGGRIAGYSARALLAWVRKTGAIPGPTDPVAHMLHLQRDQPEVTKAARWFMEPVDYLAMRFTGVAAATQASMAASWLIDNRTLDATEYDATLIRLSGVDGSKLPPLRPMGSIIGPVTDEVAAEIGLPLGTPVVAGVPDLHSSPAGSGALDDYSAHLGLSTHGWIGAQLPTKKTDIAHQVLSVPGTCGRYVVVNSQEVGASALKWLRENIFGPDDKLGDTEVEFDQLTELAATAAPGSGGVLFTPWLAGERSPVFDPTARGGFHNLSLTTNRADLVRAVLEGVAFNGRWLNGYVEKFTKRRLDPIRVIGGGATSDLWCQIHADVLDRTLERPLHPLFTQLRGAALLAGIALGVVDKAEVKDLVPVEATFTPNPANRATYDHLYEQYAQLYKTQKGMFGALNRP